VQETAIKAGIQKRFSPHRIRHSGITQALEATQGDVRRVQKLSRHKNIQTLLIYDDHRRNSQGEITNLLSDLIDEKDQEY
jgi:integrase/recombinase XerC